MLNGSKGGRVKGKHHGIWGKFSKKDLAEAVGVSYWSIKMYFKKTNVSTLKSMTLLELYNLITELRIKKPLNTKLTVYKKAEPIKLQTKPQSIMSFFTKDDDDPDAPF